MSLIVNQTVSANITSAATSTQYQAKVAPSAKISASSAAQIRQTMKISTCALRFCHSVTVQRPMEIRPSRLAGSRRHDQRRRQNDREAENQRGRIRVPDGLLPL